MDSTNTNAISTLSKKLPPILGSVPIEDRLRAHIDDRLKEIKTIEDSVEGKQERHLVDLRFNGNDLHDRITSPAELHLKPDQTYGMIAVHDLIHYADDYGDIAHEINKGMQEIPFLGPHMPHLYEPYGPNPYHHSFYELPTNGQMVDDHTYREGASGHSQYPQYFEGKDAQGKPAHLLRITGYDLAQVLADNTSWLKQHRWHP